RIEAKTAQNETVSYIYAESHALVIGVSQYRNGWSNLPGVRKDVKEVSQALQENGFQVTTIEDPGLDQLEIAIEDFIFEKGVNPENRLLIYYAGHGHTMKLGYGGEMGFLVPADAPVPQKGRDAKFRRQALSMQRIEEVAKNTSAKHVLFMFDACFAGSVFLATRAAPAYIQQNTKEPVRQFITSGSAEQEVPDKSIFRRAFVDALNGKADYDKDGYLTGTELGAYIQKRTAEDWEGKLTPQYGKLQDPNLNKGDFVFELSKPEVVKPPPAEPAPVAPPEPQQDYANLAWQLIKDLEDPKAFEEFIKMFPESPQSNLAKLKLIALASSVPQKAEESMAPPAVTETVSPPVVTDNVVFEKQASTSVVEEPIPPKEAAKTQLLQTKECIGCDLRGTDLSGTTLRAANLSGANLSGATLEGAYLVRADLSDANLQGTNLRDASLRKADISGTDIAKAFLCNTFMPDGSINNRDCEQPEPSPKVQVTTTEDFEATSQRLQQKTDSGAGRRYKWNPDIVEDRLVRGHWQRQPHLNPENQSAKSYFDAKSYCESLNLSGWENWRLPTRRELVSLFEEKSPAKINLDLFAVDYENNVNYWSKTREVVG
ncbi:MAG: pentapeptide repeat-containing protein, partial [Deltaproteobacteria bacterium]